MFYNSVVDVVDKASYYFKENCPAFSGETISYVAVGFYFLPHLMVVRALVLAGYDRNFWNYYKGSCLIISGLLLWAISSSIHLEQNDDLLCREATRSHVSEESANMALIAMMEMWHHMMVLIFPEVVSKITNHSKLTTTNVGWSFLIYTALVLGSCWGLVYLHVFTIPETVLGVAIGLFNAVWLSCVVFFFVVPNFNSRLLSYFFSLCCIQNDTIDYKH